jgi:hypothetical protein
MLPARMYLDSMINPPRSRMRIHLREIPSRDDVTQFTIIDPCSMRVFCGIDDQIVATPARTCFDACPGNSSPSIENQQHEEQDSFRR